MVTEWPAFLTLTAAFFLLLCCGSGPTRRSLLLLSLSLCSSKITVKSHDPCIHSLFSHSFLSFILSSFSSLSFILADFFWPLKCKFVTLFPLRPDKVDLPLHHRHIHSLSVFPPSSLYYRFSKNSFLDQELSSLTNYFAFCPDIKWIAMSFSFWNIVQSVVSSRDSGSERAADLLPAWQQHVYSVLSIQSGRKLLC